MSSWHRAAAVVLLAAAGCAPQPGAPGSPATAVNPKPPRQARCELVQSSDSQVDTPFLAFIRDDATYGLLARQAGIDLPKLEPEFFPAGIVVAAFLGPRPTPGYRVSVLREGETFRVEEETPPRDAILAQVVTRPFVVCAFAEAPAGDFRVDPGAGIGPALRRLRLSAGKLEVAGGIAGIETSYPLTGDVRVASLGGLTTLLFDLDGTGAAQPAHLATATTFAAGAGGQFAFTLPAFGSFIPPPCRAVAVSGVVDAKGPKISAQIESAPCTASDSFHARGSFSADPVDPPSR